MSQQCFPPTSVKDPGHARCLFYREKAIDRERDMNGSVLKGSDDGVIQSGLHGF